MTGMAAGLALSGLRPITYTITPFVTTRCLEQIRVDICYHHVPVVIVGVGSGLSYMGLGVTHHSCEDIAFLRVLPNMVVTCPGDAQELRAILRAAFQQNHPLYIRLGKKGEPVIHPSVPELTLGKSILIKPGHDICLLSTGNMLPNTLETASLLEEAGISSSVVSFHTVKPLDTKFLTDAFQSYQWVVTIEEHSKLGGFGSSVAEWLTTQKQLKARLLCLGTPDSFPHYCGSQEYARQQFGLDPLSLKEKILQILHD